MADLAEVIVLPVRQASNVTDRARHTADAVADGARRALGGVIGGVLGGARQTAEAAGDWTREAIDAITGWPRHEIDAWGRDPQLVDYAEALMRLRWRVAVNGHQRLPKRGGALIIVNTRRFALAPVFTALATGIAVGRPVRFAGRPDIAPLGPLLQRIGALLDRPDEIEGALRAGELVVVGAVPTNHARRVGHVHHGPTGAAVAAGAKVFPAAAASGPFTRSARVEIGSEIRPNRRRRGPLVELELADDAKTAIQRMLDELGGPVTSTPLDWLPMSGMGGS